MCFKFLVLSERQWDFSRHGRLQSRYLDFCGSPAPVWLAAEAARGARFRELYAMLGLRAAIHADGTLEITVGATGEATKGVMPCDEPG